MLARRRKTSFTDDSHEKTLMAAGCRLRASNHDAESPPVHSSARVPACSRFNCMLMPRVRSERESSSRYRTPQRSLIKTRTIERRGLDLRVVAASNLGKIFALQSRFLSSRRGYKHKSRWLYKIFLARISSCDINSYFRRASVSPYSDARYRNI